MTAMLNLPPVESTTLTDPARRWLTNRYQSGEKHMAALQAELDRCLAEAASLRILMGDLQAEQEMRAARLGGVVSLLPSFSDMEPEGPELPLEAEAHAAVAEHRGERPYADSDGAA